MFLLISMREFSSTHILQSIASYNLMTLHFWFGDSVASAIFWSLIYLLIGYLVYLFIIEPLWRLIAGVFNFIKLRHADKIYLEITPPHTSEKSSHATEQLFTVVENFLSRRSNRRDPRAVLSLEMVSTKKEGVRYVLSVSSAGADALQRYISSYLPESKIKQVESPSDELKNNGGARYNIFVFSQRRHYAYPFKQQADISQSDLVAYMLGSINKLEDNEATVLQIVIAPHYSRWTNRLYNKILNKGHATIEHKVWTFIIDRLWVWVVSGLIMFADFWVGFSFMIIFLVIDFFVRLRTPEEQISVPMQKMYEQVLEKLGKPLFKTSVRVYIGRDNDASINETYKGVVSSLATIAVPGFQGFKLQSTFPHSIRFKFNEYKFKNRLPALFNLHRDIYSTSEIADMYHFPYGLIKAEGVIRSHSRTLPATNSMKNGEFDVVLGQNNHHGEASPIGLTTAERERHVFIIGGTGNGKTTLLQYALVQDIQNGKGVAVVDPHGDMAETLLQYIPKERTKDLIYFNPDDLEHPIGLNLLELTPGLEGDELLREKDLVTESVVSVFRKIFSEDDTGGHRIEYVLRNAIQTALYVENATLFTIYDLLNDPAFRKLTLKSIDDKNLQNFWRQELGKAGDMQKVKMAAGITAKIGRFLFSASAKRILEQPKSTIDFDEILDGKILICNFSKGLLGEDTSELFGIAILAKIQLASLRRARIKQKDRKPFYLYVDEFQNFATPSFTQMLSEARKYKLYLTMAEQSTSQQDDQKMINTILANVGTVICFRSGNPADEKLILPLFEPYIEKGEIANLPSYNFYMRVSAQKTQEPISGETIVLD